MKHPPFKRVGFALRACTTWIWVHGLAEQFVEGALGHVGHLRGGDLVGPLRDSEEVDDLGDGCTGELQGRRVEVCGGRLDGEIDCVTRLVIDTEHGEVLVAVHRTNCCPVNGVGPVPYFPDGPVWQLDVPVHFEDELQILLYVSGADPAIFVDGRDGRHDDPSLVVNVRRAHGALNIERRGSTCWLLLYNLLIKKASIW